MNYRIAQLSDTHLTASSTSQAWRSPVWESFRQALVMLEELGPLDRLILTGDLANQRKAETYAALRQELEPWLDRLRLVPGNHDSRRLLVQAFGERVLDRADRANFVDRLGKLRLIGLDSLRRHRVSGKLGTEQLSWLQEALAESPDPALLFVHHPVLRVGCWWLDKDILRDRTQLGQLVRASSVRALFFGHVHQEFTGEFAGIPVYGAPSTAYQFRPGAIRPGATGRGEPALRIIEVDEDCAVTTRVVRATNASVT